MVRWSVASRNATAVLLERKPRRRSYGSDVSHWTRATEGVPAAGLRRALWGSEDERREVRALLVVSAAWTNAT